MKSLKVKIRLFCKRIIARKSFYRINRFIYSLGLYGIGILNYESDRLSGEYSFLKKLSKYLAKDAVVIDVGANVGRYANLLKQLSPQATVYAFEPHPITFKTLLENAKENDYHVFQLGCGKEKAKLKLYDYREQDGSSHASMYQGVIEDIHRSSAVEHDINIIRLDDFLTEKEIKKVSLIKIDAEGNEYRVLEGLHQSIKNGAIEIIHWEFNNMNVISRTFFKDFYDLLSDYSIFRMLSDGLVPLGEYNPLICEIYAFQNIVAVHKNSQFKF